MPREIIRAFGILKLAAARANASLGLLDADREELIVRASQEVADGSLDDHFPLVVWQTGSGTQTNMNANEVIANRAIELAGGDLGSKEPIHPNDHVNLGQSSNDTIPTAMHVAAAMAVSNDLMPALRHLQHALEAKAEAFADIVKIGRTHLQDATPLTLGQEVSGWVSQLDHAIAAVEATLPHVYELALGGTAVGTGLNTDPDYRRRVLVHINEATGHTFTSADNLFEAMQGMDAVVEMAGALRVLVTSLRKIGDDFRLLGSGLRTGLAEIRLPAVQPGSSIMPGKVDPVLAEMLNMACFHVMGNDLTVMMAGQAGQLELNVMMPIVAHNLFEMMQVLIGAVRAFTDKCVAGVGANRAKAEGWLAKNAILVTALNPVIGYLKGAEVAKEAMAANRTIKEIVVEKGYLTEAEACRILDARKMTEGGIQE